MKNVFVWFLAIFLSLSAQATDRVLERGNFAEPGTLDPHRAQGDVAGNILRDLYEGLLLEGPDANLLPGMAVRWEISSDGLQYVFHLRKNARWSNGDPLTAEDFVSGLRRSVDPATASPYANHLSAILNAAAISRGELPVTDLGVSAKDDHTLIIKLVRPTPYFLALLVRPNTVPVHRPSLAKYGDEFARAGRLVSNGAYLLENWTLHSHIALKRNPHYWNVEQVRIERVNYYPINDEMAELNRFRSGGVDITYTIPPGRHAWLSENLHNELKISPWLTTYFLVFNLTREPFKNNFKLRRALSMVVDRDIITKKITANGEIPAYGLVPPGIANYESQESDYVNWPMPRRVAEARVLYREAGYSVQRPLRIELRFNAGELHRRIAVVVSSMWKEQLGVETSLVSEEWKVFHANKANLELFQVFRSSWGGDYNDAYTFAQLFESSSSLNEAGYKNPEYDALLVRAENEADSNNRRKLLQKAEEVLLTDQPLLPLYFLVSKHLVNTAVGGWRDNIMDHHLSQYLHFRQEKQQ
ncbi:MAG: peptide ABC transporter substrate-binding protein [Gammaproteobacteria bacterium]